VANAAALTMEDVAKRSPSDCDFAVSALLVVLPIVLDAVSVLRSKVEAMNNLVVEQDEEEEDDHWDKGICIHAKAGVSYNNRVTKSVKAARVGMERDISMACIGELSNNRALHCHSHRESWSEAEQRRIKLASRHSSVWSHFSNALIGYTTSVMRSTTSIHD
jgi:hypothetical protein